MHVCDQSAFKKPHHSLQIFSPILQGILNLLYNRLIMSSLLHMVAVYILGIMEFRAFLPFKKHLRLTA